MENRSPSRLQRLAERTSQRIEQLQDKLQCALTDPKLEEDQPAPSVPRVQRLKCHVLDGLKRATLRPGLAVGTLVVALALPFGAYSIASLSVENQGLRFQANEANEQRQYLSNVIGKMRGRLYETEQEVARLTIEQRANEETIAALQDELNDMDAYLESSHRFLGSIWERLDTDQQAQVEAIWLAAQPELEDSRPRLADQAPDPRDELRAIREDLQAVQDALTLALAQQVFTVNSELRPVFQEALPGSCRVFVAGGLTKPQASKIADTIVAKGVDLTEDVQLNADIQNFPGTYRLPKHSRYSVMLAVSDSEGNLSFLNQQSADRVLKVAMDNPALGAMIKPNHPYVRCL
jgi:hypothetical protein